MAQRSRTEYSIINMMASFGGYILNILLSFVCRIVFVHQLNAEYLGINGLFSNILSMLSLAELGIGTAMIYALYKPVAENDQKKIASYMKVYGTAYKAIGAVIAISGLTLTPFLNLLVKSPPDIPESLTTLYLIYLFSTVSSYFYSYRSSILIAHQENYIVLAISYGVVVVQNLAQILALVIWKDYMMYLILQVIFVLLTNVLISMVAKKQYPYITDENAEKLSKEERKSLLRNVKALTVTRLSGILVNNTDNIVITYFNGLITTGVVSNYSLITNTITSLANQIFTSLSASLGNLNAVGEDEHKYEVFKALNLANFWLYGWAAIGMVCLSSDVVELFFGESYVMESWVPIILTINFYMLGMQCVVGLYKSTMVLFRYGQYVLLFTAVLNLIGDILLGQLWGVFGIFLATAIARALTNTWYEPFVVFKHGFRRKFAPYIVRYLLYAGLLAGMGTVCWTLCKLISFSLIFRIIVKCLICIILPNVAFFLIFRNQPEFQYLRGTASSLRLKVIGHFKSKI